MKTKRYIFFILFFLFVYTSFYGQSKPNMELAENLLQRYMDYSHFKNGINSKSIDSLKQLFEPKAKIIFDIPFINTAIKNDDIKRISKDDRQQSAIIPVYGKLVSIDMYIETLRSEAEKFQLINLDYTIKVTGKKDSIGPKNDTVIFEVEKQFINSEWSVESRVEYLFYMRLTEYNLNIFSVVINSENTAQTDVKLKLVDASPKSNSKKGYFSPDTANLMITFSDRINNYHITGTANSDGIIVLKKAANNNSKVYLKSVTDQYNNQYYIPDDWRDEGKNVSDKPSDEIFIVGLKTYEWNGIAYALYVSGGSFIPESVSMSNFNSGSSFETGIGYKFGINFNTTYFFNTDQLKVRPKKWIFGLGSGISVNYQKSSVSSNAFSQQTYQFIDKAADTSQIFYQGQEFKENNDMVDITIPIFLEFKKKIGEKSAISFQAGVNFAFPVSSSYNANGSFSNWGYYDDLNPQPITDDSFYNYYTDSLINYTRYNAYNTILADGFIKIKGLFNVFKKNPHNSLEIGLMFSMPITASINYSYSENQIQDFQGYWISTENGEYHSPVYSANKLYQYYFGISLGINLVRYKL